MCPASERGAMPQALMVSVDRDLIMASGSQCPMTVDRSVSIRRLTDFAITRFHPRKLFGSRTPIVDYAAWMGVGR